MLRTAEFETFADQAAIAPHSLGRISAGIVIVALSWIIATFVLVIVGAAGAHYSAQAGFGTFSLFPLGDVFQRFMQTPAGLVTLLLSFSGIWLGLWIAVRTVHKRPLSTILGKDSTIMRGDFARGLAVFGILVFIGGLQSVLTDPFVIRSATPFALWAALAVVLALALLIQTSAEEALFRGHLMQVLAARFRTPVLWFLLPCLSFAVLHYDPEANAPHLTAQLGGVLLLALALAWLVVRTGALGAAMGAHLGNNLVALLFVSANKDLQQAALYVRGMEDEAAVDWPTAAVSLAQIVVFIAIGLTLLLHRRSWFAVEAVRMKR